MNQIPVPETRGYDSVTTKTPNRSEYQGTKVTCKTSNKHKSIIIIQAPSSAKADGSTDDAAIDKAFTESPSKHRKIVRGF
jgi:hypothetical protein